MVGKILLWIVFSALFALRGKNRKIGYIGSFILCLLVSPILGAILTRLSPKKDVEFIDENKDI